MNRSPALVALVPPGVLTLTSTPPAPDGDVALSEVPPAATTTLDAAAEPNVTVVPFATKFVPVTVTVVPPPGGPNAGLTALTVGAASYVNWSAALVALVPPGVVTVTSAVPDPAGDVAVMCEASTTVTFVPAFDPKRTEVAPVKFVPVIVTLVPPPVGPAAGLSPVTVGTAAYVYWSAVLVELVPPGVVTERQRSPIPRQTSRRATSRQPRHSSQRSSRT